MIGEKMKRFYKTIKLRLVSKLLVLTILISVPLNVFANGGPIDGSAVIRTGNIQMVQQKDITLDEENLSIKSEGGHINFKVIYKLTNHGKAGYVDYAFPVDYFLTGNNDTEEIYGFKIRDGNTILNVTQKKEVETIKVNWAGMGNIQNRNFPKGITAQRKWSLTRIYFPTNTSKIITVNYQLFQACWGYKYFEKRFDDLPDILFLYSLYPAKNWGNGIIKKFKTIIDFSDDAKRGFGLKNINLKQFTIKNGIYTLKADNFDLSKNKDIQITLKSVFPIKNFVKKNEYQIDVEKTGALIASSTLKGNYMAKNLLDGSLETTWAGTKGVGDSVEINLKDVEMNYIGIINGNTKNKEAYENYGKVKKLKVEIDEVKNSNKIEKITKIIDLENKAFEKISTARFLDELFYIDYVTVDVFGNPKIRKVKLTILDTYKGKKYKNACISELLLLKT